MKSLFMSLQKQRQNKIMKINLKHDKNPMFEKVYDT